METVQFIEAPKVDEKLVELFAMINDARREIDRVCGMPLIVDPDMPEDRLKIVHPDGRTDILLLPPA